MIIFVFGITLLALLFLCAHPARAEEAKDTPASLPQIGETRHGFVAEEIVPFPAAGADIVRFRHLATGAQLLYIANDDTNRFFDLTFLTEAVDSTGLPHIFEHATLGGSRKYPGKSFFFNLIYQTYNTFINAMTSDLMTTYPVASLSEKQLLALADVYTDSCLHPLVMEDESIFREEAWRYRLESEDAPLTLEGTVYSEMKGAINLSYMAGYNLYREMFPGSLATNLYGGDPDIIPTLSWERLKAYHDQYYTPSNCVAFLYGRISDPDAFLRLLDEAFTPFGHRETIHAKDGCSPVPGFREAVVPFPAERGSDTKNVSAIQYGMACPRLSPEDQMNMDLLGMLLGAQASPLMQRLQEELPAGDFSCGWDPAAPGGALVFSGESVNAEDAPVFRRIVDEELQKLSESGFPQDMADAAAASIALEIKLLRENKMVGLNLIQGIAYGYATTGRIWQYLEMVDALNRVAERNADGTFAALIRRCLLSPASSALVTTMPQPGLSEEKDAALAEQLAVRKAAMTADERAALIEASNREEEPEDTSALIASVQAVTIPSLPEEIRRYEVRESKNGSGVRFLEVPAGVDGVGRVDLYLDAAGISQELLHWARLYLDITDYLDGDRHTRQELATRLGRYLFRFSTRLVPAGTGKDYTPRLFVSWIARSEDLAEGYETARELLHGLNPMDGEKVLGGIRAVRADFRQDTVDNPYTLLRRRAFARTLPGCRYLSYLNDLDYFAFLKEAEALVRSDPAQAGELLSRARDCFFHAGGAVFSFAGDEGSIETNRKAREAFLSALLPGQMPKAVYDLPIPNEREALIVDSQVQYNGIAADYETLGLPESGALGAVTSLISDALLYPLLRDRYGAYGVMHGAAERLGLSVISYRDPNLNKTFETYDALPDLVETLPLDTEKLSGYILSRYSSLAAPAGELAGAGMWVASLMEGLDPSRALTQMRELKALTPESAREILSRYRVLVEKGARFSAGGAAAIRGSGLFDVILDPFAGEEE